MISKNIAKNEFNCKHTSWSEKKKTLESAIKKNQDINVFEIVLESELIVQLAAFLMKSTGTLSTE